VVAHSIRFSRASISCLLAAYACVFTFFSILCSSFFFFNDPALTEIYTLSLHDALPICGCSEPVRRDTDRFDRELIYGGPATDARSEEHTSELQSPDHLVCRLLLEKKNTQDALR